MNWKLKRNSATVTDPGLHALCQNDVMSIARNEVASSLSNPDDRPSRLKFLTSQAVVEKTLEVKSGHIRVFRVVPPGLTAKLGSVVRRHCFLLPLDQNPAVFSNRKSRLFRSSPRSFLLPLPNSPKGLHVVFGGVMCISSAVRWICEETVQLGKDALRRSLATEGYSSPPEVVTDDRPELSRSDSDFS